MNDKDPTNDNDAETARIVEGIEKTRGKEGKDGKKSEQASKPA